MTFTPKLFIGVGLTNAMYTLRETYLHTTYSTGYHIHNGQPVGSAHSEVRSFHHFNLGQDADEAYAKAQAASENMAIELSTTPEQLDAELRDIKRATPSEIAERQRIAAAEQARWEAEAEQRRIEREAYQISEIDQNIYPFGPYRGQHLSSASVGYMKWLIDTSFDSVPMQILSAKIKEMFGDKVALAFPEYKEEYVGTIGGKIDLGVRVVAKRMISGYYGPTNIITMIDAEGHNITTFASGKFGPETNSEITIRGTIKSHKEFRGTHQTVLTRVKEI